MRSTPTTLLGLVAPCLALATACTPVSLLDRKITVSAQQFQDVPVPAGFRLVDRQHQSHSLRLGAYRYGDFVYRGRDSVDVATDYLLERLPQHAWDLTGRTSEATDVQLLDFERGDYRARYRIRRIDSATQIEVELRTHAQPVANG